MQTNNLEEILSEAIVQIRLLIYCVNSGISWVGRLDFERILDLTHSSKLFGLCCMYSLAEVFFFVSSLKKVLLD